MNEENEIPVRFEEKDFLVSQRVGDVIRAVLDHRGYFDAYEKGTITINLSPNRVTMLHKGKRAELEGGSGYL